MGRDTPTGAAGEADHVEPGSVPSSLTCNRPTLASTRRGFAHKIVPNGVQLWRRLCSPLGVPPDDDDDGGILSVRGNCARELCLRENVADTLGYTNGDGMSILQCLPANSWSTAVFLWHLIIIKRLTLL